MSRQGNYYSYWLIFNCSFDDCVLLIELSLTAHPEIAFIIVRLVNIQC